MATTPYPFVANAILTASQLNSTFNIPVSTKTVSYVLVAADAGTRVVMNSASATTITVNTSLFAAGDNLQILNIGAGVCTVTAGTATVSTSGTLALVANAGGTLYFTSTGVSVFQATGVAATSFSTAIFNETQANGTDGGASVATTFTKRVLNTTNTNGITGCSIASSVITLATGTYIIQASSPLHRTNQTQIRLRNTTDSTNAIIGISTLFSSTGTTGAIAYLAGLITIAANKDFELQYYATTAQGSNGLGTSVSSGIGEVYSVIQITKVA